MSTLSPHIIIVDDDLIHRNFFQMIVTQVFPAGQVTLVATGYDALIVYRQYGADLLIVDHWLPDVQGYTLLQYLRDTGMMTPIIMVSGYLPSGAIVHDERTVILQKPVRVPELIATLTQFLPSTDGTSSAI